MKYLKSIATIITIVAGIIAIISFYYQIFDNTPEIEIKTLTKDKLTKTPSVQGLNASFEYKDRKVKNLWKLNYLIENIGDEIIIGESDKKNILKNHLTFLLPKNFKILEIEISNKSFPFKYNLTNNKIMIFFQQWKPYEGFELSIYTEESNNSNSPNLTTNERDIINGIVYYSSVKLNDKIKKPIAEHLPEAPRKILWWFLIILYFLLFILLPAAIIGGVRKKRKYNKWYKTDLWMYEEWIQELLDKGELNQHYTPRSLPSSYWNKYPYIKPTLPEDNFGDTVIGSIVVFILIIIPILWILKV